MFLVLGQVCAHADFSLLPQAQGLFGSILNFIYGGSLLVATAAFVIGAAQWALSNHGNNVMWAQRGRSTAILGGASALLIGAAPAIVNALEATARHLLGSC
jgi:hypothetical protein